MFASLPKLLLNSAVRRPDERGAVSTAQAELIAKADLWRQQYNPIRGLTAAKAVTLLDASQRGDHAELQWLYYAMERRWGILRALVERRAAALGKIPWTIKTVEDLPAGATKAMAEAQAKSLKEAYGAIDNIKQAVRFLALAEFRGFAHLQKHRTPDGDIVHLEPLYQWNWVRDGMFGDWFWNQDAQSTTADSLRKKPNGVIDTREFVIRAVDRPVNEVALGHYIRSGLALKDWTAFLEIYGIPGAVVTGPENASPDKEATYQTAAERIAQGGSGYLPFGSKVEFSEGPRTNSPFKEFLDDIRADIVMAGTSGKLTMLNDATGLGSGNAEAHEDSFDEIAEAEACTISEILQRAIDADVLKRNHPDEPTLAYFELSRPETVDVDKVVEHAAKLSQAGYEIDPKQLEEMTGYRVTKKELPTMDPNQDPAPKPLANRRWGATTRASADFMAQQKLIDRVSEDVAGVSARYLAPVREVFADLITKAESAGTVSDQDMIVALENAARRMPELFGELDVDLVRRSLERAMGAAVVNGAVAHADATKG